MLLMCRRLMYLILFFPFYVYSLEEVPYTFSTSYSPIVIEKWIEEKNITISQFEHAGFESPVDSLKTFFYLGRENRIQDIIDMHYEADGTKNYIKNMLVEIPDALLGSKNLKEIVIKNILYWGKHRTVYFKMVDDTNQSVNWAEDFVCSTIRCYKSNFSFFDENKANSLLLTINNSKSIVFPGLKQIDSYHEVLLYPETDSDSRYPLSIFVDRKSASDSEGSQWHRELAGLKVIVEESPDNSDEKLKKIQLYLQSMYAAWDENTLFSPYFSRVSFDKSFFGLRVLGFNKFDIKYYLENPNYVWAFVEGYNPIDENRVFLLFSYNKKEKSFEMSSTEDDESKVINNILKNDFIASNLFEEKESEPEGIVSAHGSIDSGGDVSSTENVDAEKNILSSQSVGYLFVLLLMLMFSYFVYKKIKGK